MVFEGVTIRLGRTTSLGETRLEPQALELGEIVVTAERPLVDLASPASVTNLPSEQFEDLPTPRDFRSIVSLAPQANLSLLPGDEVNIAGGTGPENAYYLDGVNITDPRLGATSSNLPYNFVRELQVKAGGYEAEFGRASGGIIDVITHSGGNRFRGQVFGFFTGNGLRASPGLPWRVPRRVSSPSTTWAAAWWAVVGAALVLRRVRSEFRRQRVEVGAPTFPTIGSSSTSSHQAHLGAGTEHGHRHHRPGDPSRHREFPDALLAGSVANPEA